MDIVASGSFWDATTAPVNERSVSSTDVLTSADGAVLVTCRLGSDREGADGHSAIFATQDGGDTWDVRWLGLAERIWDDQVGETRGWYLAELAPGELLASVLWTDRSDPSLPWVHPETQGVLGMRTYQLSSDDGGRSWHDRRRIDLGDHPGASCTGAVLSLAGGLLAQPFETWKTYDDPGPAVPGAWLRLSHDDGATWSEDVLVARHPDNAVYYWDQRFERHPDDGRWVAMFWTHRPAVGRDADVHVTWGSADGRRWTEPVGSGLPGQHCQPVSLGGDRLLAVYTHRQRPPGIQVALSEDFGRTWDLEGATTVWSSDVGDEPGTGSARAQGEYWNDMGAWRFGHPRATVLPSGEVLVVFYGGSDERRSGRWVRLRI